MFPALLLALAPQVPGGFDAGELVVKDAATHVFQLVDPIDGTVSTLDYGLGTFTGNDDDFEYDPYRDRLAFKIQLTGGFETALCLGTATGTASIAMTWSSFTTDGAFAADGKGRIYFRRQQNIEYLDLDGSIKAVKDPFGANFQVGFSTTATHMEYDPGTNSLITSNINNIAICATGGGSVRVRRFDLSADGTQVVGEECTSFNVGSYMGGNGEPKGLTLMEPGKLLVACEGSEPSGQIKKIVKLIEPTGGPGGTLAVSDWADPTLTYAGGNTIDGVAYSYVRDQLVLLNGFFDSIYAYHEADASPAVIPTSLPLGREGFTDIRSAGSKGLFAIDGAGSGTSKVSVGSGGQQDLFVDFGPPAAADFYFLTGSFSGFTPFPFAGVSIPATFDAYTTFTINNPNSGLLVNTFGVLDVDGRAGASIALPPAAPTTLVGVIAHHTALRITATTVTVAGATTAVPLEFVP